MKFVNRSKLFYWLNMNIDSLKKKFIEEKRGFVEKMGEYCLIRKDLLKISLK